MASFLETLKYLPQAMTETVQRAGRRFKRSIESAPTPQEHARLQSQKRFDIARNVVPAKEVARGLGISMAKPFISKQQEATFRKEADFQLKLINKMKEADTEEDKNRYREILEDFKYTDVYGEALRDAPTTKQITASAMEGMLWAVAPTVSKIGSTTRAATKLGRVGQKLGIIGKEAGIGGGLMATIKAQEKESDTNDIIKAAEFGAMLGGGLTATGIGTGYVANKLNKFLGPKVGSAWKKINMGLERAAKPSAKGKDAISRAKSYIGLTTKQKVARTGLKTINQARKLKTDWIDRFSPAKRIEGRISLITGKPPKEEFKIYRDYRLYQAISNNKAESKILKFQKAVQPYADDLDDAAAYLQTLNWIDRAELGQKVAGGRTLKSLEDDLVNMTRNWGAKKMRGITQIKRVVNNHTKQMLDDRVAAGLITKQQRDAMLATHPNYMPHDVIMNVDEQAYNWVSNSMNVARTDLKKAMGSLKEIEDPIEATLKRTHTAERIIEKNRILNNLVKAQEELNIFSGMKGLQTAQRVKRKREIFTQMGVLKKELKTALRKLKKSRKYKRATSSKIRNIQKNLENIESSFSDEFTSYMRAGEKVSKKIPGVATTRSIPDPLVGLSQKIRKYKNLNSLKKTKDFVELEKAFQSGKLERWGFRSIDDFFQTAKTPFKKKAPKITQKTLKGKLSKLKKLTKKDERLRLQKEILEDVDMLSADDAVRFFDKLADDIKLTRKTLWQEAQKLSKLQPESGYETINLFREGIKETWQVPQDIAYMIKNVEAPIRGGLWKGLTLPAKTLRRGATKYNLSFAIPNKFRDVQTATLTSQSFIDDIGKRYGFSDDLINASKKQIDDLYASSGGYGASIFEEGEDVAMKQLQKSGLVKKYASKMNPGRLIEKVNRKMEISTRMNVFEKAIRQGLRPKDAALVARDASIDFAKMGAKMQAVNQAVPFLNARVQGFTNLSRAFVNNPETFARLQLYTSVYPTALLHKHNRTFNSYKNIGQYYKNKYWVIMTGETEGIDNYTGDPMLVPQAIMIPKGEGQVLTSSPLQYFLDKGDEADYRTVSEMLADTVGAASPLEFQSFDQANWVSTAISQLGPIASVPYGLASNKHPYFGTEIVPGEQRKKAAPEVQYKKTTPEVLKEAGDMLNVSPAQIQFVLDSVGAGVSKDIQRGADIIYNVVREGKMGGYSLTETPFGKASRIPILRRFLRETSEYGAPEAEYRRKQERESQETVLTGEIRIEDKAREIWLEMKKKPSYEERLEYLNSLGKELTPEMKQEIERLNKGRKTFEALTPTNDPDVRAHYIWKRLQEIDDYDERVKFLDEMEQENILTESVRKALSELKK